MEAYTLWINKKEFISHVAGWNNIPNDNGAARYKLAKKTKFDYLL